MPAPYYYRGRPPESLADHINDLSKAFSHCSDVLSQHYSNLNQATNGLLDGTYPWQGLGATSFSETWQTFGKYMLSLQKSCEDTSRALTKFANKISDIEAQQAWDMLMAVVGGILTIVSFAAMIAELGLNPFVDGFFALISTFTEQDGAAVVNASEEITQADSEAAIELQTIEEELTTVPTLSGTTIDSGNIPYPVSSVNLEAMVQGINNEVVGDGQGLVTEFFQQGEGSGNNMTAIGQQYIQDLKNMGVTVIDGNEDPDTASYMTMRGAKGGGVTWFGEVPGSASPDTTTVLLGPEADNAAAYEEYLHVQRGAGRGWVGLDEEAALVEEIQVETQVLSEADRLDMTPAKRLNLEQNIANYRQQLWNKYQRTVP